MMFARRLSDPAAAKTAVQQLTFAVQTLHDGGNAPLAAYYETRLAEARTLFDRLNTR
jgi:hypothetical protein